MTNIDTNIQEMMKKELVDLKNAHADAYHADHMNAWEHYNCKEKTYLDTLSSSELIQLFYIAEDKAIIQDEIFRKDIIQSIGKRIQLPQIITRKVILSIGLEIKIREDEDLETYAKNKLTYTVRDYPEHTNKRVKETGYYHIQEDTNFSIV